LTGRSWRQIEFSKRNFGYPPNAWLGKPFFNAKPLFFKAAAMSEGFSRPTREFRTKIKDKTRPPATEASLVEMSFLRMVIAMMAY